MADGEDLRDRAAGVVGHEVDILDLEFGAHRLEEVCESGKAERLSFRTRRLSVKRQVDGDAPAALADFRDDMPPEKSVRGDAVNEQRRRARADVEQTHTTVRRRDKPPSPF